MRRQSPSVPPDMTIATRLSISEERASEAFRQQHLQRQAWRSGG